MATERKSAKATGSRRHMLQEDGSVRVWSSVGITVAITDDPPQFLKLEFGHERIAKNDTTNELRRVARLIDEFNEAEIEKRVDQYSRLIKRHEVEVGETDPEPRRGSVKERARRRRAEEDDTWN